MLKCPIDEFLKNDRNVRSENVIQYITNTFLVIGINFSLFIDNRSVSAAMNVVFKIYAMHKCTRQ